MSNPERPLQSAEYYLKFMSWHAKEISTTLMELTASINLLNTKIDSFMNKNSDVVAYRQPQKAITKSQDFEDVPF